MHIHVLLCFFQFLLSFWQSQLSNLSNILPLVLFVSALSLSPSSIFASYHTFLLSSSLFVDVRECTCESSLGNLFVYCLRLCAGCSKCVNVVFLLPSRTLTELLKQPGEGGAVDGTGVHHPIGTNGISARALRSNNGKFCFLACMSYHTSKLSWQNMADNMITWRYRTLSAS